ncbi:bifunctional folylpolyglutamate synthase/dihydrofolate synthase [Dietzia alimentaria]|uniref:bifunctional folylpolyglutamate synthase/dihydrofolate synthase n=1 Tax=Dietzia alimentaria TaxID=665550 RepID=UPI00029A0AB0|nr:folylpolyglutamate synthase/dihydrofolate synthase family protein [Dietzia alimentaria]
MSGRQWLPPHDPEEGWDAPTEEDVAEMLGEDGLVAGVSLGGPIPGDEEYEGDDHLPPRPIPEVGSPEWQADTAELVAVEEELATRWPESKLEPSLDRIAELTGVLGDPQHAYPVVHVAGTNGKTSVTRMVDALLRALHQRTGRNSSPHLQSVIERIALDGEPITARTFVDTYRELQPYLELVDQRSEAAGGPRMSYFEVITAMAFAAFADAPVDVAVVETGMGGTWDATNVVHPAVAVVTPIGLDHTEYLGEDLETIAGEKAGIIQPGPQDELLPRDPIAVIGRQEPEAMEVLIRRATEVGAIVARLGSEFDVTERRLAVGGQQLTLRGLGGEYTDVFLPLFGVHQAENAATALAAVEAFFGAGPDRMLDPELIRAGFAAVDNPGRLERLSSSPTVLVDAAHNGHGGRALAKAVTSEFDFKRLVAVVAMLDGKDADAFLTALEPVVEEVVVTRAASARAMPLDELALVAEERFTAQRVHVVDSLPDAVSAALDLVGVPDPTADDDVSGVGVLVTGSVVTAGAARSLFGKDAQ